jgi:hypothetical protein
VTVYLVTGRLGGGKTLVSVGRMVEYLERGRPVATNLDIDLSKLPATVKEARIVRVPDKPSGDDLGMLGKAHDTPDESNNGLLVLDECGVIFNAREWNDKGRQGIVDWLLHSRKLGWDVLLIVQAPSLLDKQLREALCEMHVVCRRLDRLKVPFLGVLGRIFTFGLWSGKMPRMHVASVRYGMGLESVHAETWWYRGNELFGIYDTRQRFRRDYVHGPFSMVDWRGYTAPKVKAKLAVVAKIAASLPPDERVRHVQRLERLGLLARA